MTIDHLACCMQRIATSNPMEGEGRSLPKGSAERYDSGRPCEEADGPVALYESPAGSRSFNLECSLK